MKNRIIIITFIIFSILPLSCNKKKAEQLRVQKLQEIQGLLNKNDFEAARVAAIDTLDPAIRELYHKADDKLGHASHLDVRCNERIESILYDVVKKVPRKNIRLNRDIYSQLLNLYPKNTAYEKKFIYYDRKMRRSAAK
jgi:hypothetical protein